MLIFIVTLDFLGFIEILIRKNYKIRTLDKFFFRYYRFLLDISQVFAKV